ncbi:aspartate/glutamate racemase family protein [Paenibacillus camerounensis]|uniref:aspartate/glutamate racemase family protein n=1 Tax=Paenibacillus camerounensis TaxID=1243663 RepID=UPI0005AABBAE|nr:aspartate/glutamate racemase family protein [Paenibacillus camerounensis]
MNSSGKRIGLIHATLNSLSPMSEAVRRYAPDLATLNFLDEGLITDLNACGKVTRTMLRRFIHLLEKADEAAVEGVLLSCSSFTPYVSLFRELFNFPIISVDYSMLEQAVERGSHIGVIATVATATPTTVQILRDIAVQKGKDIHLETSTLPDAFEALQAGDIERHNSLIQEHIKLLSKTCEVIVLAQISMARALDHYDITDKQVLTSPESSIQALKQAMSKLEQ